MPIHNKRITTDYSIVIWEINEPVVFFEKHVTLTEKETQYYSRITNPRRQKEWLAVRYILQYELNIQAPLSYTQNGKPIVGKSCISISHSSDFVVVMISTKNCAVDIEKISPRVQKIAKRAFSEQEIANAATYELLTLYWCVKETVYKLIDYTDIDFREDLKIQPFSNEHEGKVTCEVKKPTHTFITLHFETIKNNKFVWTIYPYNKTIC